MFLCHRLMFTVMDKTAGIEITGFTGFSGKIVDTTYWNQKLTVVVVMTSSVTTFSVSTTEMYPRRLAIDRAVFPF